MMNMGNEATRGRRKLSERNRTKQSPEEQRGELSQNRSISARQDGRMQSGKGAKEREQVQDDYCPEEKEEPMLRLKTPRTTLASVARGARANKYCLYLDNGSPSTPVS